MKKQLHQHFQIIEQIIQQGKTAAYRATNTFSILVKWQVGFYLSKKLATSQYGDKVVDQLAKWLLQQQPSLKGFDRRSLYRMRTFFETWSAMDWSLLPETWKTEPFLESATTLKLHDEIVVTLSPQLPTIPNILLRINWSQHIDLLSKCVSHEERCFYLGLTIKERYDVRELRRQIKSSLFERQMLAKNTLLVPERPQKELLAKIFRDRYIFEFLDLPAPYSEHDLKKGLIGKMKKFLLELGKDFLFVEEEMHLKIGMEDYFIDLVFYHRELQCLVAFELKIEAFKPEHLGKLNFYLEVLDRDVRKPHENPAIGVLLCKTKNDETVEIAMSRQLSPSMVAAYQTKFVDKELLRKMLHQWSENWENSEK